MDKNRGFKGMGMLLDVDDFRSRMGSRILHGLEDFTEGDVRKDKAQIKRR